MSCYFYFFQAASQLLFGLLGITQVYAKKCTLPTVTQPIRLVGETSPLSQHFIKLMARVKASKDQGKYK